MKALTDTELKKWIFLGGTPVLLRITKATDYTALIHVQGNTLRFSPFGNIPVWRTTALDMQGFANMVESGNFTWHLTNEEENEVYKQT